MTGPDFTINNYLSPIQERKLLSLLLAGFISIFLITIFGFIYFLVGKLFKFFQARGLTKGQPTDEVLLLKDENDSHEKLSVVTVLKIAYFTVLCCVFLQFVALLIEVF